jgi:predicted dienelactone hydrolase
MDKEVPVDHRRSPLNDELGRRTVSYHSSHMRRRSQIGTVLLVASVLVTLATCAQPKPTGDMTAGAAARRFVFQGDFDWRGAATQALLATVWYPAAPRSRMSDHGIGSVESPLFRLGAWADDAPLATGRFPLIVLSHGTGGSAQIMSWLGRGLAARGYIVAAVNHPGNNALEPYTPEGFLVWWERAVDLTKTIDLMLRDQEFGPAIDKDRIGAAGFSLGGYTVIALAGGRTAPEQFRAFCESPRAEGCSDPPEFPGLFAKWAELEGSSLPFRQALTRARESVRDVRVRSVFAIAPALGPAFIEESLRDFSIPVAIVAGLNDRHVPVASNAEALARLIPSSQLTLVPDASHYTFLATCTEAGRSAQPALCSDTMGLDRDSIHQRTTELTVRFFDDTLR